MPKIKQIPAHTPGEWKTGLRRDGNRWLSIGDPKTGRHYQGDLCCSDADAILIVTSPELLEFAREQLEATECICAFRIAGYTEIACTRCKAAKLIAKTEGR